MKDEILDQQVVDTIRTLSMDAVQKANSGHPGAPMGLAPVGHVLWSEFLRHNPANPHWMNRDRFVLSAGHASMLLYSLLHLNGYAVSMEDLKQFRQLHSKTPGHPEFGHTPGVETTTGPLGQGFANSVGIAMAGRWFETHYNKPGYQLFDYQVYAIGGDGCMMEGVSSEAASLAGHLALGNLTWLYDSNRITIEGSTDLAFSEDVAARFTAYGWQVLHVSDANDMAALREQVETARVEQHKPSLIIVQSHIAFGSPNKQDTHGAHGSPLGDDEIRLTKQVYGLDPDKQFFVPEAVQNYCEEVKARGKALQEEWDGRFAAYANEFPQEAAQLRLIESGGLPEGWDKDLPVFEPGGGGIAGRSASEKVLNVLAERIPWLIGGSADLAPSTKTLIKASGGFARDNYGERNLHFGIREHAMGAIVNGMSLSGLRTYGATFLVFSDYMRPTLRLAALMHQPAIFIYTHDSIGVGEDGPTHQPVEHVASLRLIPNLDVIRPADANEVSVMWKHILRLDDRPCALVLTRQNLPTVDRSRYSAAEGALRGAYVLADGDATPEVILIASGSEVQLCISAHESLLAEGITSRVVSMACTSLFDRQDEAYRNSVLPPQINARVAVEAGTGDGWQKYVGRAGNGSIIAVDRFGASGPDQEVFAEYGLTAETVIRVAKETIKKNQ